MNLNTCSRCHAVKVGDTFHCRNGTLTSAQMNTRVCIYGRPKGGCINTNHTIIESEKFENRASTIQVHPEIQAQANNIWAASKVTPEDVI